MFSPVKGHFILLCFDNNGIVDQTLVNGGVYGIIRLCGDLRAQADEFIVEEEPRLPRFQRVMGAFEIESRRAIGVR